MKISSPKTTILQSKCVLSYFSIKIHQVFFPRIHHLFYIQSCYTPNSLYTVIFIITVYKKKKLRKEVTTTMLLYVLHGNDEKVPFNGNCKNIVLLCYIRETLGYGADIDVDLVPAEASKLQDAKTVPLGMPDLPTTFACEVPGFVERGLYALVTVAPDDCGGKIYSSLLTSDENGAALKTLLENINTAKGGKAAPKKKK